MHHLARTLGNKDWLSKNEDAIKKVLPDTWTHAENLAGQRIVSIAYTLKLLGVNWTTFDEFGKIMVYLEKIGFLLRQNGYQVMANPQRVF